LEESTGHETEAEQFTDGDSAGKTMRGDRQRHSLAIVLLFVLGLVGCNTAVIPAPTKNPVPAGMALGDVRRLIVLPIDKSTKTQWDNPASTSQKVLREFFASLQASNKWNIESTKLGSCGLKGEGRFFVNPNESGALFPLYQPVYKI